MGRYKAWMVATVGKSLKGVGVGVGEEGAQDKNDIHVKHVRMARGGQEGAEW